MSHPHSASLDYVAAAARWFAHRGPASDRIRAHVLERAAQGQVLVENPLDRIDRDATFGERLADQVARLGGSWWFIGLFACFLVAWAAVNTVLLGRHAFDPYPYIFLNLMLSMLAAIQAPIIMMSQNRQAAKDRQMAEHDYAVNLKAEVEILALHDKLDALRAEQLATLLAQQQAQIDLLTRLVAERGGGD